MIKILIALFTSVILGIGLGFNNNNDVYAESVILETLESPPEGNTEITVTGVDYITIETNLNAGTNGNSYVVYGYYPDLGETEEDSRRVSHHITSSATRRISYDNLTVTSVSWVSNTFPFTRPNFIFEGRSQPRNITMDNIIERNDSITIDWDSIDHPEFEYFNIYLNDELIEKELTLNTLTVSDLNPDTTYHFKIETIYENTDFEHEFSVTTLEDPADYAIERDLNLREETELDSTRIDYDLPDDLDFFSHLKIYRNDRLIKDEWTDSYFIDDDLDELTEYSYSFVMVTTNGVESEPQSITIETPINDTPLDIPQGLTARPRNGSIMLDWQHVSGRSRLEGYNIYMNGEKINDTPINRNNYVISDLSNDVEYNFFIRAVNTSEIESDSSEIVIGTPLSHYVPAVNAGNLNFGLVGSTATNFVSELWLPIAFIIGIVLSFYVIQHIKLLLIS